MGKNKLIKQMKAFIATVLTVATAQAFDFTSDVVEPVQTWAASFPLTAPEAIAKHNAYFKPLSRTQKIAISREGHSAHMRIKAQRKRLGMPRLTYYEHLHGATPLLAS